MNRYVQDIKSKSLTLYLILTICYTTNFAQTSFPFSNAKLNNSQFNNRATSAHLAAAVVARSLPFWDDFSFIPPNSSSPLNTLWDVGSNSVQINSGMGINPPTINVATFDGYDSIGRPYSLNNISARGIADKLTSCPLKLGDVVGPARDSVKMTFFFQYKGSGDIPEIGDALSLLFKNNKDQWIEVWSSNQFATFKSTAFEEIILPIKDPQYFHNGFQFRFQNFGRLSGPYDTWNIDYIFVSNGKSQYLKKYEDFPDRAIRTPLTSILKNYQSMPVEHFFKNANANLTNPSVIITNRRKDQNRSSIAGGEPSYMTSKVSVFSKKLGTTTEIPLQNQKYLGDLYYDENTTVQIDVLPDLSTYNQEKDSLSLQLILELKSRDNLIKQKVVNTVVNDFDTIQYKGIDFRSNDVTRKTTTLTNYYAYDDGEAEYGARISGDNNTEIAYEFALKLPPGETDTLTAVDLYLPQFGDNSNQTILFQIMRALEGKETDYLYRKNEALKRSTQNKFWRVPVYPPVVLNESTFYVGWKLNSSASVIVGVDKSSDSGDKIFINATGTWQKNTGIEGNLMIRPVFGKVKDIVTRVTDENLFTIYPNPTKTYFYLPVRATSIYIYDITGRGIHFDSEHETDRTRITLQNQGVTGMLIVRYFNQTWKSEKIIILP